MHALAPCPLHGDAPATRCTWCTLGRFGSVRGTARAWLCRHLLGRGESRLVVDDLDILGCIGTVLLVEAEMRSDARGPDRRRFLIRSDGAVLEPG